MKPYLSLLDDLFASGVLGTALGGLAGCFVLTPGFGMIFGAEFALLGVLVTHIVRGDDREARENRAVASTNQRSGEAGRRHRGNIRGALTSESRSPATVG